MNPRNTKDGNPTDNIKKNVNNRQNTQSIPIKQTNTHRSCLKHQPKRQSETIETGRTSIGTGRVSFAHATGSDGKILLPSQSQNNLIDKKHRSDVFAKKAKELQLAELTYFKDHARDKELIDE